MGNAIISNRFCNEQKIEQIYSLQESRLFGS